MKEKIASLLQREIDAIRNLPIDDTISGAVDLLFQQVHVEGGKIVVSGMGKAGQIGQTIATTFSSTGSPAVFLHPSEAQHGDLGLLQANDILLILSNSGKTTEILLLIELVKGLYPDLPVICITGHPRNSLGQLSTLALGIGEPVEICPLGLTPTTSTTVMTVLGDVIVVLLMERIAFTRADYSKRHHSGYLGKKSRERG
ncbi:MAG: SIS domain-containing protein [Bacteroidota bacterium]